MESISKSYRRTGDDWHDTARTARGFLARRHTPGNLPHALQARVLAERGVSPPHVISASTADAILGFVESGLGFSIVPSLDPDGPKGRAFRSRQLKRPIASFTVVAAWRKGMPDNPLVKAALATAPMP